MKPLFLLAGFLHGLHAASLKPNKTKSCSKTGLVTTQDGVHLNYTQSGPLAGQKILFIPGWRQTAAEWKKQVEYFSSTGYRVTAYDMRGHGESEKPDFGYRISRFAADLNDLLNQLDLKDVSIVAHSMGSSISWAWWDQYPDARDRIDRFVFVDQSSVLTADPHWTEEQAKQVSALFDPIGVYDLADDMTAQTPPFVRSMFTDSISEADFEWVLSENKKISDKNAATLVIDHAFRDWRDVLPRIHVPSLVIAGEVSVNAAPGIAWVATQIPGGKSYTFTAEEKGSHFMFWENPERFNSIVEDFITP
ncbi:hypothetical protein G7Z17_g2064 [Cylindrodendrum hubeiense]|uniref:AB hydrolase-1 domain-containing protein n=1 Tax=Cylindrodendrum hubeiense TaxID=595255 RepID=A0A9P5HJJ2_9HYPO|nr:hypothetical protein G7Z17_g2064 [Cylindrodendrum hubeiense]